MLIKRNASNSLLPQTKMSNQIYAVLISYIELQKYIQLTIHHNVVYCTREIQLKILWHMLLPEICEWACKIAHYTETVRADYVYITSISAYKTRWQSKIAALHYHYAWISPTTTLKIAFDNRTQCTYTWFTWHYLSLPFIQCSGF